MTPTREQLIEEVVEEAGSALWCDLCEGDGQHSEALDKSLIRKHLRKLAAAIAPQEAAPCIGRDPLCPCQDGDSCHYRDGTATDTKAWPIPAAPMPPIEVGDWVEDNIHIRAVLADRDVEWWNSSEAAGTRLNVTEIRKANGTVWRRP